MKREYAIPAEYDKHGIKKAGLRSYRDTLRKLTTLRAHLSGRVRNISYGDLAAFKRLRLNTPVTIIKRAGSKRSGRAARR